MNTTATPTPVSAVTPARKATNDVARRVALGLAAVLLGLFIWYLASLTTNALFLPSPVAVWQAARELAADGTLWDSTVASSRRILIGWVAGLVVGIPLGILMGHFRFIREALDPYIEFFRFIPPIAFVTLAVIWMGPGELAKIALIFYTTVFIVTLNALAGTQAVSELRLRAAASLGAGPLTTLWTVIVPSTVPYLFTGARIAMGNSFLTIVSAEIVAAEEGLGALIWNARNYSRTEWVFAGILTLGCLGFLFDRVLRAVASRYLKRYGVSV